MSCHILRISMICEVVWLQSCDTATLTMVSPGWRAGNHWLGTGTIYTYPRLNNWMHCWEGSQSGDLRIMWNEHLRKILFPLGLSWSLFGRPSSLPWVHSWVSHTRLPLLSDGHRLGLRTLRIAIWEYFCQPSEKPKIIRKPVKKNFVTEAYLGDNSINPSVVN